MCHQNASRLHDEEEVIVAAQEIVELHNMDSTFLCSTVIGDETWSNHDEPERKRSKEWHYCKSLNVFWGKGAILLDVMPNGTIIDANSYTSSLSKLKARIHLKVSDKTL